MTFAQKKKKNTDLELQASTLVTVDHLELQACTLVARGLSVELQAHVLVTVEHLELQACTLVARGKMSRATSIKHDSCKGCGVLSTAVFGCRNMPRATNERRDGACSCREDVTSYKQQHL